jgi:parallel beta-helix repeat protein
VSTRVLLAAVAATLVAAVPAGAGTPSPADGGAASPHLAAPALPTALFALLADVSELGVPAAELASVGPASTPADSDGDNLLVVDDGTDCPNAEYPTIQSAVDAADPYDRIKVCRGTYPEQVVIPAGKDGITLFSEGFLQAVIKAPPLMLEPGDLVHVNGARDVTIRHFTISGPLPDHLFCSLQTRTGVKVDGGGSLLLTDNHITEIRSASPLLRGCQNGIAVRVGSRFANTGGSAEIRHNLIDRYQKGAVVIDGPSHGHVHHNEIVGVGPQPAIAPNGIQISRGASANVHHNEVTGNSYSLGGAAGTGILLFETAARLTVGRNEVYGNDDGISLYDVDGSTVEHNDSHDQRVYDGLYADSLSTGNRIQYNRAERNAEHDCHDDSAGPGTAGTANVWIKNHGLTENRPGLCRKAAFVP